MHQVVLAWLLSLQLLVTTLTEVHTQLVYHVVRYVVEGRVPGPLTVAGLFSKFGAIMSASVSVQVLYHDSKTVRFFGIVDFHLEHSVSGALAIDSVASAALVRWRSPIRPLMYIFLMLPIHCPFPPYILLMYIIYLRNLMILFLNLRIICLI